MNFSLESSVKEKVKTLINCPSTILEIKNGQIQ